MKHIWCTPVGTILCYSRSEDSKEACLISPEEGNIKHKEVQHIDFVFVVNIVLINGGID